MLSGNSKGYGSKSYDTAASTGLVAFNRRRAGEVERFELDVEILNFELSSGLLTQSGGARREDNAQP